MIGDGENSGNQKRHDYREQRVRVGFLTDPTLCIGCKACEVACKEWNGVPQDGAVFRALSYDNTGELGASTWRHVKFVELEERLGRQTAGLSAEGEPQPLAWLFLSDVCKHCEVAGCLEACPTGAIIRNEVGAVYVQNDVCNGCGYCVVSCPFGVIDRRPEPQPGAGAAYKCTFCYDRQIEGLPPACAKACPTESIAFGALADLEVKARRRLEVLSSRGFSKAKLYDCAGTSVGGTHALFITVTEPERFGLPSAPEVPTVYLKSAWFSALLTALCAAALVFAAFASTP